MVTEAVSVDLISTVGDWATTVTSSATVDGFMIRSMVSRVVVVSLMLCWTEPAKPWSWALTVYSPGGRAGKRYCPWASVTNSRVPMRFGLDMVTVAPGRGSFCSSITIPEIAPVSLDWEKRQRAKDEQKAHPNKD